MATKEKNKRLLTEQAYSELSPDKKKRAVKLEGGYYIVYPLELQQEKFRLKEDLKNQRESEQVTARDNAERSLGDDLTINDFKKRNEELSNFVKNAGSVLDKDWRFLFKATPEMDWVKKSLNALNSVLDENVKGYINEQGIFDTKKYSERLTQAFDEFIAAAENYCASRDPGTPPGKRRKKQVTALLKRARQLKRDSKALTDSIKQGAVDFKGLQENENLNTYSLVSRVKNDEADLDTIQWQNQGNSTDVYRLKLLGTDGKAYYLKENLPFLNEDIEGFFERRTKQLEASRGFAKSQDPKEREKAEERLAKISEKDYQNGIDFIKNLSDELKKVDESKRAAAEEKYAKYFAHNFDDIFLRFRQNNLVAGLLGANNGKSIDDEIKEARENNDDMLLGALEYAKEVMKASGEYVEGAKLADKFKKMSAVEWLKKEFGLEEKEDKAFLDSLRKMSDQEVETLFRVTMGKEVELFGQMSAQKMQVGSDSAAINNTAVSLIAEDMGFDDVITKSHTSLVKFKRRDGSVVNQFCTLTEEAEGTELVDLMKAAEKEGKKLVYSSEAIRDLMRLYAIDTLTLQKDRHGRNFKCKTEPDAKGNTIIKSVKAYDNDMSMDPITLAEAFPEDNSKLQFLPKMTTKVEKGSALYKYIVGSYFGVDVLTETEEVKNRETPNINFGRVNMNMKGDVLGYPLYLMWRSPNERPTSIFSFSDSGKWMGAGNVVLRKNLKQDDITAIQNDMKEMGIKFDSEDAEDCYRNYALKKFLKLSDEIKEIWLKKDAKTKGWKNFLKEGLRADLSPEERMQLSEKVEELTKLGKRFDFEGLKTSMGFPGVDAMIKSIGYLHGIAFADTLESRVIKHLNKDNYKDLELITDKKGNLEIPTMLHYDKDAFNQLEQKVKGYEDKNSLIYQRLKERGISDDKIQATAKRGREMVDTLKKAEKKAKAFYRLAGWTKPPQNEFFLEKEQYKELGSMREFAVDPGKTYLSVDNENYLCGQEVRLKKGNEYVTVKYTDLMNDKELQLAKDYNSYILKDEKRWKYGQGENYKEFDKANTENTMANATNVKDYIECCKSDKIYEIAIKPVNGKEDFSTKLKEVIFLNGLANSIEHMENHGKPVTIEEAKSHMQPDSKIHEQFDRAFTHAAGIYYQKAFDAGINQLYTDIKMFDENAVKKFNETCLDGMFKQIFENLKNNKMSENEVINLATHGGVIASNSGVKPEDALNHFVIKNQGLVPENIINQVKDGFIHKPLKNEGPQAGPAKEVPKQGNLVVNPNAVKLPGM